MPDAVFARNYAIESWSLYGVGVFLIALRITARIRRFGWLGLKIDDYVMLNGLIWYTILCVAFNQIASGGGSNLMTQEEIDALTPESKADRINGSKWVFVSENAMYLCIWSMKICMLVLYASITEGLKQRQWVNWVAIYTALSFVASELALFLACRPFHEYWAVPAANPQCSTYQHSQIINASLSIPGDFAILAIGIPILASLRMPIQQKAILLIVFGMGFFIIIAAILTKVYGLVPSLLSYVYMNWYFREASVAVYVTNIPTIWPLIREMFPSLQTWGTNKPSNSSETGWGKSNKRSRLASKNDTFDMKSFSKTPSTESQERINDTAYDDPKDNHIAIQRDVTFTVQSESKADSWGSNRDWDKQKVTTIVNSVN